MIAAPFSRADLFAMQARSELTLLLDLKKAIGANHYPPVPIQQSRQDLLALREQERRRGHLVSVAFIDYQLWLADTGEITLGATRQQISEYARAIGPALANSH